MAHILQISKILANSDSDNFAKKRVEQKQKPFRAMLFGKGFFESEIQSGRSELWMFNGASRASFTHGHNTSFKGDKVNEPRILYKKSAIMPYVTCSNIEKFAPQRCNLRQTPCPQGLGGVTKTGKNI
jgi:hypothetical protein